MAVTKIFVKPADESMVVRDPALRRTGARKPERLPVEGAWKPRNRYWLRRVAAGDVVEVTTPSVTTPPEPVRRSRAKTEES
jgi:hypothetical protein